MVPGSAHAGRDSCPRGYKNCDTKRKDCATCIMNDVNNCGNCGNKCQGKPDMTVKCENHQCVYKYECKADTKNDVNNCGRCGYKCTVQWKGGEVKCENGQCKQQCKYGYDYDWNQKCCVEKKKY
jgi:hypothetical protein